MKLKRGDVFIHQKWLDENYQPCRCVVTAVRQGVVYWKQEGEKKAKMYFSEDLAYRYVKEIVHSG